MTQNKDSFISHYTHSVDDLVTYTTYSGKTGVGVEICLYDYELEDSKLIFNDILNNLKALPENILGRIILKCSKDIKNSKRYHLYLFLEQDSQKYFKSKVSVIETLHSLGFYKRLIKPLTEFSYKDFRLPHRSLLTIGNTIKTGASEIGIIKLYKQTSNEVSMDTLKNTIQSLPAPFDIHVTFKKACEVRMATKLKLRANQLKAIDSDVSDKMLADNSSTIVDTYLDGARVLNIEWQVLLERLSEQELKCDLKNSSELLNSIGDTCIEKFGLSNAYLSTRIGSYQHFTFQELSTKLGYLLPMYLDNDIAALNESPKSLCLKRNSEGLTYVDIFDPKNSCFNVVINGKPGSGKSVLGNLLTCSLLNDPPIHIIKVDVGGSYKKECEENGGLEISFKLDKSIGIDPFRVASTLFKTNLNETVTILTDFITTLVQENDEIELSKDLYSKIEEEIKKYAASNCHYSFNDFVLKSNLARIGLLKRWCSKGVYESIMSKPKDYTNRYLYFNFENIQNASNPDFAQGCMSLVIAYYNLNILNKSNKRFVFFVDEAPFFINRNFRFFKLTASNARKYGHSLVLIAQSTNDLIGQKIDDTILKNSPIRFFFQIDGKDCEFQERFGLPDTVIGKIKSLKRENDFREVVLNDDFGSRLLRIELTKEEYWKFTSSKADNEKLDNLITLVPNLKREEAIRCLSLL